MTATFDSLVEQIRGRTADEKAELKFLIERELVEERRQAMLSNYRASRREEKRGQLKFSSKMSELRKSMA